MLLCAQDEDDDDVSNLFDRAKRSGAVQGTSDDLKASESSNVFQGTGRTLAGGVNRVRTHCWKPRVSMASIGWD